MSKNTRKKNRPIVYEVETRKDKKERTMMIFQIIAIVVPILISALALAVSLLSAYFQTQYSEKTYEYQQNAFEYQKEAYEYLLDPVFGDIMGSITMTKKESSKGTIKYPILRDFSIAIDEENNLETVYMISPDYKVHKLPGDNYTKELKAYFSDVFESYKPDYVHGDTLYYYRFLMFSGLDDELELNLFYCKTHKLEEDEVAEIQFDKIDKITLLQLEKTHGGDPDYEGERIMAAKFREILEYYKDLNK